MTSGGVRFARPIGAAFVAAVLGYAGWAAFTGDGRFIPLRVGYGLDSALYIRAARSPVWSFDFLATPNGGPFLFLLLAKLCLRNLRTIVVVQSLLSGAAWLFLAHTVAMLLRETWVRVAAFCVILLVALSPAVLVWNATIATESLAVSLMVVAISLSMRVATGVGTRSFVALLVVLIALACTRDTNVLLVLVIAAGAAVVVVARPLVRRRALAMVAVCALAAGVNIGLANKAQRWYYPLTETISVRVLGSPMATDYFVAHGMPYDASVRELHANYLKNIDDLKTSPRYGPFRRWVFEHGRSTYAGFLARHPGWVIGKPFADRERLFAPELPYGRLYHDEPRGAFRAIGAIAFPGNAVLVEAWMGAALVAALVVGRRRDRRRALVVVGVVAGLVVPAFLTAWHGDVYEVDRHSLSAAVQLRIVLWVVAAITVDSALNRSETAGRTRRPRAEAPTRRKR